MVRTQILIASGLPLNRDVKFTENAARVKVGSEDPINFDLPLLVRMNHVNEVTGADDNMNLNVSYQIDTTVYEAFLGELGDLIERYAVKGTK